MSGFSGNVNELSEAISYERGALEFIRSTLFDQRVGRNKRRALRRLRGSRQIGCLERLGAAQ
jgi:hypothetical protein